MESPRFRFLLLSYYFCKRRSDIMLFLCFGMFLIILSVLAFFRNRSVRRSEDATEAFWSREYESNHIRKKDISDLSYIEIPLDALPLHVCSSERCISLESQLTALAGKKIVNLSNLSNTDLKLTYGTANLTSPLRVRSEFHPAVQPVVQLRKRTRRQRFSQGSHPGSRIRHLDPL